MFRRKGFAATLLALGIMLFGFQAKSQAQSVGSDCYVGSASSWLHVMANGWFSKGKLQGNVYMETATWNLSGNFSSLTFTTLADGTIEAIGSAPATYNGIGQPVQVNVNFLQHPNGSYGICAKVVDAVSKAVIYQSGKTAPTEQLSFEGDMLILMH